MHRKTSAGILVSPCLHGLATTFLGKTARTFLTWGFSTWRQQAAEYHKLCRQFGTDMARWAQNDWQTPEFWKLLALPRPARFPASRLEAAWCTCSLSRTVSKPKTKLRFSPMEDSTRTVRQLFHSSRCCYFSCSKTTPSFFLLPRFPAKHCQWWDWRRRVLASRPEWEYYPGTWKAKFLLIISFSQLFSFVNTFFCW